MDGDVNMMAMRVNAAVCFPPARAGLIDPAVPDHILDAIILDQLMGQISAVHAVLEVVCYVDG